MKHIIKCLLAAVVISIFSNLSVGCRNECNKEDFELECTISATEVFQQEEIEVDIFFKNKKNLNFKYSFSGSFLKYCLYNDNVFIPDSTTNEKKEEIIPSNLRELFKIDTATLDAGEYYLYAYTQFEYNGTNIELKTKETKITIKSMIGVDDPFVEPDLFCSIKVAYENGYITKDDVVDIAEIHNNGTTVTPTDEIADELRKAYAEEHPRKNFDYQDVVIKEYVGEFSGGYAAIIAYRDEEAVAEFWSETIANIRIIYNDGFSILFYKKL